MRPEASISKNVARITTFVNERWQEHLLLFSSVKNKVILINPNFVLPLKLEIGEPTPLGLFTEAELEQRERALQGAKLLEVWPRHHVRSAILGRLFFADAEGRVYRDIDLKGIGVVQHQKISGQDYDQSSKQVSGFIPGLPRELQKGVGRDGLVKVEHALHDCRLSEEFTNIGIRTHRVLSIIELEQMIIAANKFPLETAVQLGLLDADFTPVISVRAFRTKARVLDLDYGDGKLSRLLLEDAKSLIGSELGQAGFSTDDYLTWFAQTLGSNVGLMHKAGYLHGWLSTHNLTLDCRIADLDTVGPLTEESRIYEFEDAQVVLAALVDYLWGIGELKAVKFDETVINLKEQFANYYNSIFTSA